MKARVALFIAVLVAAVFVLTMPLTNSIQGAGRSPKQVKDTDLIGKWETTFRGKTTRDKASIDWESPHSLNPRNRTLTITNQFGTPATGEFVGGRIKVTSGWTDTTPEHPLYGTPEWKDEKLKIEWGDLLEGHGKGGFWVKQ